MAFDIQLTILFLNALKKLRIQRAKNFKVKGKENVEIQKIVKNILWYYLKWVFSHHFFSSYRNQNT